MAVGQARRQPLEFISYGPFLRFAPCARPSCLILIRGLPPFREAADVLALLVGGQWSGLHHSGEKVALATDMSRTDPAFHQASERRRSGRSDSLSWVSMMTEITIFPLAGFRARVRSVVGLGRSTYFG